MRQTIIVRLIALVAFIPMLQSCVKNLPPVFSSQDHDLLLLSKVTGHSDVGVDLYEYDNHGNYLASYAYGTEKMEYGKYKPLRQISFMSTGTWDFIYNHTLPTKTLDYSLPGKDQGYWQYFYNDKGQIEKTGLAFKSTDEPTEFEFYDYDNFGNLTTTLYGKAIDTPFQKTTYNYDAKGNLTELNIYLAVGYSDTLQNGNHRIKSFIYTPGNYKGTPIEAKLAAMRTKFIGNVILPKSTTNARMMNAANSTLSGDSNVIYTPFYNVKITCDDKINPFSQQNHLLYYQTNRWYVPDWNTNYMALLKSNPLKVVWTANNSKATSTFTYTYNALGYPVTTHEDLVDPDAILIFGNYTQDRQIEYLKNH